MWKIYPLMRNPFSGLSLSIKIHNTTLHATFVYGFQIQIFIPNDFFLEKNEIFVENRKKSLSEVKLFVRKCVRKRMRDRVSEIE